MKNRLSGMPYIIGAAALWGLFPVFTRILYSEGITVAQAVAARAATAGIIYLVIGWVKGCFSGLGRRDFVFLSLYGFASLLGTYVFYSLSIKYLSAAMAAMLLYTAPAFVIIFDRIIWKDKLTPPKLIALAAAFFGSCLVVRVYDIDSLVVNTAGIIFGLLSGISYSMLTVIGCAAVKRGYSATQNTVVPAVAVGILAGAAIPVCGLPMSSAVIVLCYLGLGIVGSVLPYFLYQKGLASGIDGSAASILANIEPVTATIFGVLIFADSLEAAQVAGMAIVLGGAAIGTLAQGKAGANKDN